MQRFVRVTLGDPAVHSHTMVWRLDDDNVGTEAELEQKIRDVVGEMMGVKELKVEWLPQEIGRGEELQSILEGLPTIGNYLFQGGDLITIGFWN